MYQDSTMFDELPLIFGGGCGGRSETWWDGKGFEPGFGER